MGNNLIQPKGIDTIFSLFIIAKIDSYLENNIMDAAFFYDYNRLVLRKQFINALSSIRRNYPKIIINNVSGCATEPDVKETIGYKAMLLSKLALTKH